MRWVSSPGGLLSPLTYRGLRVHGGLSPKQAVERSSTALVAVLGELLGDNGKEAANRSSS